MGKKSGRKENSRHCGEKNVVLFRHRPYPKKQILSHLYLLNRRQNQPPPE